MNKYLQLFRLGNALMGIVGLTVASFMAVGTDVVNHGLDLVISAIIVFLFIAGGNSLNDYIDAEIDKTAHPERPVPSGRMTPIQARNIGIGTLGLSVVASLFTFDIACIAIVVIAAILITLPLGYVALNNTGSYDMISTMPESEAKAAENNAPKKRSLLGKK